MRIRGSLAAFKETLMPCSQRANITPPNPQKKGTGLQSGRTPEKAEFSAWASLLSQSQVPQGSERDPESWDELPG